MENIILALLIPVIGTTLGSAFVFFMKEQIPSWVMKTLLGFASGVMIAASVWSLLIPAMEMVGVETNNEGMLQVVLGLFGGFALLFLIDGITPHIHPLGQEEGPHSKLSQTTKLAFAVTIHNFPEGMAIGITLASALANNGGLSLAGALALSVGIAIQNIPEGAIVSMPLRAAGNSRLKSFLIGSASGIVEPLGAIAVILLSTIVAPLTPFLLALSAGAMLYVVIEELIPQASQGDHSNIATIGFALGFALMMVLDVVLG